MSETYRLIDSVLGSTRQVYEQDTETTVKQLETIRQVNTSTTLRHIRKEEELKQLAKKAERIESTSNLFLIDADWI
jgi:TPP-dependent pyruvate/acetoin dehydrogenase alpha subunit